MFHFLFPWYSFGNPTFHFPRMLNYRWFKSRPYSILMEPWGKFSLGIFCPLTWAPLRRSKVSPFVCTASSLLLLHMRTRETRKNTTSFPGPFATRRKSPGKEVARNSEPKREQMIWRYLGKYFLSCSHAVFWMRNTRQRFKSPQLVAKNGSLRSPRGRLVASLTNMGQIVLAALKIYLKEAKYTHPDF